MSYTAFEIVRECGHNHRTLDGAIRCKNSFGDSELGYFGRVEMNGKEVESGPELWAAEQRIQESRRYKLRRVLLGVEVSIQFPFFNDGYGHRSRSRICWTRRCAPSRSM
jgi:hypothetical protein